MVASAAGLCGVLGGALNIVGWQTGSTLLKDPFHTNFMAPNTALCLIAVGLAVLLQEAGLSLLSKGLGVFVFLFGFVTLLEYLLHVDVGIDRIFMGSKLGVWSLPNVFTGRFAPNTALAFCLLGPCLFVSNTRFGRISSIELLSIPVLWISFLSVVGYSYGAEPLYGISSYSAMALQTALCLGLLSIAVLIQNSDQGIMELLLAQDEGGMTARRLLLATIIVLPALGWLRMWAQDRGMSGLNSVPPFSSLSALWCLHL